MHPHHTDRAAQDQWARRLALLWPWEERADELAVWADLNLVVRGDCHGRYRPLGGDPKKLVYTRKEGPTLARLARHFATTRRTEIVGLHVSSLDETCLTVWWDIDAHPPKAQAGTAPAPKQADPAANLRFALHILAAAEAAGLAALLMDSNGKGGYHILNLHRRPIPMALAYRLGKFLARDHAAFGLEHPIETFPKNWRLTGKRFGNWVRLPGRHHSRDHWTRVWCPRRAAWLEGYDAINALLAFRGRDVDPTGIIPGDFAVARPPASRPRTGPGAPASPARIFSDRRQPWAGPADPGRDLALARAAVAHLTDDDADDRGTWILVGMALKGLRDAGLDLWHEFSARSAGKYDADEVEALWPGFREPGPGLVGLGWLFQLAKERGWPGPGRPGAAITRRRGATTLIIPGAPQVRTQPATILGAASRTARTQPPTLIIPAGLPGRTEGATR